MQAANRLLLRIWWIQASSSSATSTSILITMKSHGRHTAARSVSGLSGEPSCALAGVGVEVVQRPLDAWWHLRPVAGRVDGIRFPRVNVVERNALMREVANEPPRALAARA